jgi:hypothetical protein
MFSANESTEELVQKNLNTKGIPFFSTKYNHDKLNVRCKKLDVPCVVLPENYQEYQIDNYSYADLYQLRNTHLDYHYSRYKTRLRVQPTDFVLSVLLSHRVGYFIFKEFH